MCRKISFEGEKMRFCSKCKCSKFKCLKRGVWVFLCFIQVFGKWICSDCFLRSGGGKYQVLKQAKSKLRKKVPPKSLGKRSCFEKFEELGLIELRKRWLREDLNRVFECYRVLTPLSSLDLRYISVARKPKRGQMVWREVVFKQGSDK